MIFSVINEYKRRHWNILKYFCHILFFHYIMKMLIIPDLWATGMHHWYRRSLTVGAGYRIEREENNPKDSNAVYALKQMGR